MGTKGLVGFKINDGYIGIAITLGSHPQEKGKYIKNFIDLIKTKKNLIEFKNRVSKLITPMKDYIPYASFYFSDKGFCFPYRYSREIEKIDFLKLIFNGKLKEFHNEINFIKDSIYCEYAYIINLDDYTLDCYMGGQYLCSKEQKGNPFNYEKSKFIVEDLNLSWYPCKQIARFKLNSIHENWIKVFSLGYNSGPRGRDYYLNKNNNKDSFFNTWGSIIKEHKDNMDKHKPKCPKCGSELIMSNLSMLRIKDYCPKCKSGIIFVLYNNQEKNKIGECKLIKDIYNEKGLKNDN
ncbi:MAG: hypothetical protein ACFFG0_08065 [Candidatus Thorarchaeota archaeon]